MKDQIRQLMIRQISGNSDPSEEKVLHSLLAGDTHLAEEYEQLKRIWQASGYKYTVEELNSDEEWFNLEKKLNASAKKKTREVRFTNSWIGVAAAVSLLMIWTYIMFNSFDLSEDPSLVRIITYDSVRSVYLPDSSRVWLDVHSELTYTSDFGNDRREVALNGEAYFEVERDTTRKFSVSANGVIVSVLGTSFNVRSNLEDDEVEVSVSTGKVAVRDSTQMILLAANERAVYSREKKSLVKSRIRDRRYLQWRKSNDAIYHDEVTHFHNYIRHDYNWKKNDINLTRVSGKIVNNATLAVYQSVRLKATYFTKSKGRRASTYFTVDGPIRPGESLSYKKTLLFDWLSRTSNIKIEMQDVKIEKKDH